jgi:hypothetical protein
MSSSIVAFIVVGPIVILTILICILVPIVMPASGLATYLNDFWSDVKEKCRSKPTKKRAGYPVVPSDRKSLAKGKEKESDMHGTPDRAFAPTDNEHDFRKK